MPPGDHSDANSPMRRICAGHTTRVWGKREGEKERARPRPLRSIPTKDATACGSRQFSRTGDRARRLAKTVCRRDTRHQPGEHEDKTIKPGNLCEQHQTKQGNRHPYRHSKVMPASDEKTPPRSKYDKKPRYRDPYRVRVDPVLSRQTPPEKGQSNEQDTNSKPNWNRGQQPGHIFDAVHTPLKAEQMRQNHLHGATIIITRLEGKKSR